MSVVALPDAVASSVGRWNLTQMTFELEETSDSTGSSSTRVLGPPRWAVNMASMDFLNPAQSVEWEALMLRMRGSINRLALWDISRPQPRGTMRGALQLAASAALGTESISVTGGLSQAATTLLTGDWLQLGSGLGTSQLVKVVAPATANGSGVISLTIEPTLRIAFSSGVSVTWDKPVAYYKKSGRSTGYAAEVGSLNYSGHSLDLIEQWN